MEYFCKYVREIKIRKVEKSQPWLQLFEIAREAREKFLTIDVGTQNLCSREVREGHPKFTCSRGLKGGGGTKINRNYESTK